MDSVAAELSRAATELQGLHDRLLLGPLWIGWALLAWAGLLVLLGRLGHRLVAAGIPVLFAAWLAFGPIRAWAGPESALVPLAALIAGGVGVTLGLALPRLGSPVAWALVSGTVFGYLARRFLGLPAWVGAVPFASIGFYFAYANDKRLAVLGPPFFASFAAAFGASRALGPNSAGAIVPPLIHLPWVLAVTAVLLALLLPFASWRARWLDARRKARLEATKDQRLEAAIQKNLKASQSRFTSVGGPAAEADAGATTSTDTAAPRPTEPIELEDSGSPSSGASDADRFWKPRR